MIFATVGTHEQPFDRLVRELEAQRKKQIITERVVVQSGYSLFHPVYCVDKKFIPYKNMETYMSKARIVITHAGPASIFQALQHGKIPIVVPRNPEFNEHVDAHQMEFTKRLVNEKKVIGVFDITDLKDVISNYDRLCRDLVAPEMRREQFVDQYIEVMNNLMGEGLYNTI